MLLLAKQKKSSGQLKYFPNSDLNLSDKLKIKTYTKFSYRKAQKNNYCYKAL